MGKDAADDINRIKIANRKYIITVTDAYKDIRLKIGGKELSSLEFAIFMLHKQMFSLSDSAAMMIGLAYYNETCMFLRSALEIMNLMAFIDANPTEAGRWVEVQKICLNRNENDPNDPYKRLMDIEYHKYRKYLEEKCYLVALNLLNEHYLKDNKNQFSRFLMDVKFFNPRYITDNVDFSKYFQRSDEKNLLKKRITDLNEILSKDSHPTFTIFTDADLEHDPEIDVDYLKQILDGFDLATRIFINTFEGKMSLESLENCRLCSMVTFSIMEPETYKKKMEETNYTIESSPQGPAGSIKQSLDNTILLNGKISHTTDLKKLYSDAINSPVKLEQQMSLINLYQESAKELRDIFLSLEEVSDEMFNFLNYIIYTTGKRIYSIILLLGHRKYMESEIIIRNLLEMTLLSQYFNEKPKELERWVTLQKTSMADIADRYGPAPSEDTIKNARQYKDYKNLFGDALRRELEKYFEINELYDKDLKQAKFFTPAFIRKSVSLGKGFKDYYNILSKYTHPSILATNLNDERNLHKDIGDLAISLWLLAWDVELILPHIKNPDVVKSLTSIINWINKSVEGAIELND